MKKIILGDRCLIMNDYKVDTFGQESMTHLLNASIVRILHAAREKPCIFPVVGVQVKSILFFMLGYLYLIWENSFASLHSEQLVRASLSRCNALSCSVRSGCCFPSFGLPSLKRTKKNQKRKQKERKKNATPSRHRYRQVASGVILKN